ncbi:MAG: hypothetical protein ACRD5W_17465 [Candidatus Acidiferrales bacterium]
MVRLGAVHVKAEPDIRGRKSEVRSQKVGSEVREVMEVMEVMEFSITSTTSMTSITSLFRLSLADMHRNEAPFETEERRR